jgi:hypothetical protein
VLNQRRRAWLEAQLPHQEALVDAVADADYRRFKAFYSADRSRRGDDIVVGEIGDHELVVVLGRANSAEAATRHVGSALTLDAVRARLNAAP